MPGLQVSSPLCGGPEALGSLHEHKPGAYWEEAEVHAACLPGQLGEGALALLLVEAAQHLQRHLHQNVSQMGHKWGVCVRQRIEPPHGNSSSAASL